MVTFYLFFIFTFFVCTRSIQKFLGRGSNSHHSSNPSYSNDNTTRELLSVCIFILIVFILFIYLFILAVAVACGSSRARD